MDLVLAHSHVSSLSSDRLGLSASVRRPAARPPAGFRISSPVRGRSIHGPSSTGGTRRWRLTECLPPGPGPGPDSQEQLVMRCDKHLGCLSLLSPLSRSHQLFAPRRFVQQEHATPSHQSRCLAVEVSCVFKLEPGRTENQTPYSRNQSVWSRCEAGGGCRCHTAVFLCVINLHLAARTE